MRTKCQPLLRSCCLRCLYYNERKRLRLRFDEEIRDDGHDTPPAQNLHVHRNRVETPSGAPSNYGRLWIFEIQTSPRALAIRSMMAKMRPPDKFYESKFGAAAAMSSNKKRWPSSLSSLSSCSSSSDPEAYSATLDQVLDGIRGLRLLQAAHVIDHQPEHSSCDSTSSSDISSDEDENVTSGELIERGPLRPNMHSGGRLRPYTDSTQGPNWSGSGPPASGNCVQSQQSGSEVSTDYDTSAKAILTNRELREKIDSCLDKLSDLDEAMQARPESGPGLASVALAAPGYLQPDEKQNHQQVRSPVAFVPSITVCDSESSLLEILTRGGFQPAQQQSSSGGEQHRASIAASTTSSLGCPDSPASCCAPSSASTASCSSRPNSRASSRAQSPGSQSQQGQNQMQLNLLSSPAGSPQVSPQNLRYNLQRPSSSSSSSQSYCETPSPGNYQNPIEQHLEEQLGDHMINRLPIWRDTFESSDTLVNGADSSELQLQLVEEIIRGDMRNKHHPTGNRSSGDAQVVPSTSANSSKSASPSSTNGLQLHHQQSQGFNMSPSSVGSFLNGNESNDDLTNTLLKFVGGEKAIHVEPRCGSTTSGYSSGGEVGKGCNGTCHMVPTVPSATLRHHDQNGCNVKESFMGPSNCQLTCHQRRDTAYQPQSLSMNSTAHSENLQFPSSANNPVRRTSWQNFPDHCSSVADAPTFGHVKNFQMPNTVVTYDSQRLISRSSDCALRSVSGHRQHGVAPCPPLNLPPTRACEHLKEITDPREVEKAMRNLLKKPIEQLAERDADGDTTLMCLVGNPLELSKKLAYLVPLVERMGSLEGALNILNRHGEDALYLAAIHCPRMPFVAGYLGAALLQRDVDIGQRLYGPRGDTLIHVLAAKGDAFVDVMAELLSLRTSQGSSAFDLTKRNSEGRTSLHVATEAHNSMAPNSRTVCLATVRLLLDRGADPTIREINCGDTALHLAVSLSCDPALVKSLLTSSGPNAVNISNYNDNTPLHVAASMSESMSLEQQSEICWHLVQSGSRTSLANRQGKTALDLVSPERKEILRRIFTKKS